MTQKQIQSWFFFAVLVVVAAAGFFLLRGYLTILAVALTFAILFRPLFNWFRKTLHVERGVAAFFITMTVLVAVALPLTGIGILLGTEVKQVYGKLEAFVTVQDVQPRTSQPGLGYWFTETLRRQLAGGDGSATILSFVSKNAVSVFSGVSDWFFSMFLFFIALYYFTKDGHVLREKIFGISPLSTSSEEKVYATVLNAINAVMRGTIIIALLQGILAGVGFWIFGMQAPVLLGSFAVLASVIPVLGTGLVNAPAVAYLFATGSTAAGVGLAIWASLVVGFVDNMFKPKLIEQRMKVHPLLILLSILGGIDVFGFMGFVLGPLVLSVAWALAEIYREEFHDHLASAFE